MDSHRPGVVIYVGAVAVEFEWPAKIDSGGPSTAELLNLLSVRPHRVLVPLVISQIGIVGVTWSATLTADFPGLNCLGDNRFTDLIATLLPTVTWNLFTNEVNCYLAQVLDGDRSYRVTSTGGIQVFRMLAFLVTAACIVVRIPSLISAVGGAYGGARCGVEQGIWLLTSTSVACSLLGFPWWIKSHDALLHTGGETPRVVWH